MGRLTESQIQSWFRKGAPIAGKSDGSGLTFAISKSGKATWELRYRHGGKPKWFTLGYYPDISLKEARLRAMKERVKVFDGIDVVSVRRKARDELRAAKTFRDLAEDFLKMNPESHAASTARDYRRYLETYIYPAFGATRIDDVTPDDVKELVKRVAERGASKTCGRGAKRTAGAKTVARLVFSKVSVIYAFGMSNRGAKSNPCAGLKVSAIVGNIAQKRHRIQLTEAEIRSTLEELAKAGTRACLRGERLSLSGCRTRRTAARSPWACQQCRPGRPSSFRPDRRGTTTSIPRRP